MFARFQIVQDHGTQPLLGSLPKSDEKWGFCSETGLSRLLPNLSLTLRVPASLHPMSHQTYLLWVCMPGKFSDQYAFAHSRSMTKALLVLVGLPVCVLIISSHQMPFEHILHRSLLPLVISVTVCCMVFKLSGWSYISLL